MRLNRITGQLEGTPTKEGRFPFTVQFMDGIGAAVRQDVEFITVPGVVRGASISVSTGRDGNARDDDITLLEAVLLATGKLQKSQLQQDPNPNDGKEEGEVRFVQGQPGVGFSDLIGVSANVPTVTLTSNLLLDTDDDSVSGPITAQSGAAFTATGRGNRLSVNLVGPANDFAIRITGDNNHVSNSSIQNAFAGILISNGAANNHVSETTIVGCRSDGVLITGQGTNNNTVGGVPTFRDNTGDALRIEGGAQVNTIEDSVFIAQSNGNGIAILGSGTLANEITGDPTAAIEHFLSALRELENVRADFALPDLTIELIGSRAHLYARVVRLLAQQHRVTEALEWVQHAKSRTLLNLLAVTPIAPSPQRTDATTAAEEQKWLTRARALLSRTHTTQPDAATLNALREAYDRLDALWDAVGDEEYVALRRGEPLTFEDIVALLCQE